LAARLRGCVWAHEPRRRPSCQGRQKRSSPRTAARGLFPKPDNAHPIARGSLMQLCPAQQHAYDALLSGLPLFHVLGVAAPAVAQSGAERVRPERRSGAELSQAASVSTSSGVGWRTQRGKLTLSIRLLRYREVIPFLSAGCQPPDPCSVGTMGPGATAGRSGWQLRGCVCKRRKRKATQGLSFLRPAALAAGERRSDRG